MSKQSTWGRLIRRPVAVICMAWLALVTFAAAFPSLMTGQDPLGQELGDALQGPSAAHPLGTDMLGRDLYARLVHGSAESLWGLVVALTVTLLVGVTLGLVAGMYGGVVDSVISRTADVMFALPNIVILLVVVAIFPSMTITMAVFGVLTAPGLIRLVRGAAIATRQEQFVDAARVMGCSRLQILWRHLLPRLSSLVVVQASLIGALALVLQSGLGFLGFGAQPPQPSWGSLISDALAVIGRHPWALAPPGVAIGVTALALALLGDSVRDASTAGWSSSKLSRAPRRFTSVPVVHAGTEEMGQPRDALLALRHLSVDIPMGGVFTRVVSDVSFSVAPGETVGIVGESGCGKSVTMLSVLGLVPGGGRVIAGECLFEGRDLFTMSSTDLAAIRGRAIGFVSQEPNVSLDPTFRVGHQLGEAVRHHTGLKGKAARARVIELLEQVRMPEPEVVYGRYPHQISGGMAQRVAIAFALAGEPRLLIADEPTTALDVTVQAEILDLLRTLGVERQMAVVIVTHDWGVVADLCDRAVVMYAGQVVESGPIDAMFDRPQHPYTRGLLQSNPALAEVTERKLPTIGGSVPRPGQWPSGCRFAPRCSLVSETCRSDEVMLTPVDATQTVRCIKAAGLVESEVSVS